MAPPLDGKILLAAADNDPERYPLSDHLLHRRKPLLLLFGKMDVPSEGRGPDLQAQLLVEIVNEAVDEVIRELVALVDQRIVALDRADGGIGLVQRGDVGVVRPKLGAGGTDVCLKPVWIALMKIPQGRRQHEHVAGGLMV